MKQILIVEDDSFLNKMLAYNLTADGYGVTSVLNARTADAVLRQREFDLVLLDINLPDGNGFELCKLINPQRKVPANSSDDYPQQRHYPPCRSDYPH